MDFRVPGKLPTVYCDPVKITEVFVNLVDNAIKFSSKNNPPNPIVEIGYTDKGTFHEFSVKDNGIGIDPQYKEEIFGLFRRLHTRGEYEGTGAGLNIAKRIVEDHQGRIWVESELGKGAIFYFTIPKEIKSE